MFIAAKKAFNNCLRRFKACVHYFFIFHQKQNLKEIVENAFYFT